MHSNDWLEFTVQSRWPDPGFVVIDQHGRVHACTQIGRRASAAKARLVKAQMNRLAREAAHLGRFAFVSRI
jgi:hypothetical protein